MWASRRRGGGSARPGRARCRRGGLFEQRVGVVFVGDSEFEAVDDFAHAGRLLGGPIDDHGFIRRRDLAGQGDHAVGRAHLDG